MKLSKAQCDELARRLEDPAVLRSLRLLLQSGLPDGPDAASAKDRQENEQEQPISI